MSLADPNSSPWPWMPPEMDDQDKEAFALRYPSDPHRCAAEAWEAWGTSLAPGDDIVSVSTGIQSVTYGGRGAAAGAFDRAKWHRARSNVYSTDVGPEMEYGYAEGDTISESPVIETYPAGTL